MDKYTIPCTEHQTKKALDLGAPILVTPEEFYETLPHFNMNICGENASVVLPTAEEMLGWLEEQEGIKEIFIYLIKPTWYYAIIKSNETAIECDDYYPSRKEATLAAIDAALEYLSKQKNK